MPNITTVAVVGATGRQGGAVARQLLGQGIRTIALTRNPGSAAAIALGQAGAEVRAADLDNVASIEVALDQADGLFAVTNFWEGAPGPVLGSEGEVRQGIGLIAAAERASVRHVVLATAAGAFGRPSRMAHVASKQQIERRLMQSGLGWTIIRPTFFMENLLVPWMGVWDRIAAGELALPMSPMHRLQMVSSEDVGFFARLAFDQPDQFTETAFDLAGDALTGPEMAVQLATVLGQSVRFTGSTAMIDFMRQDHPESAIMWDEVNEVGTDAFVPALRSLHPAMRRFLDFLATEKATGGLGPI